MIGRIEIRIAALRCRPRVPAAATGGSSRASCSRDRARPAAFASTALIPNQPVARAPLDRDRLAGCGAGHTSPAAPRRTPARAAPSRAGRRTPGRGARGRRECEWPPGAWRATQSARHRRAPQSSGETRACDVEQARADGALELARLARGSVRFSPPTLSTVLPLTVRAWVASHCLPTSGADGHAVRAEAVDARRCRRRRRRGCRRRGRRAGRRRRRRRAACRCRRRRSGRRRRRRRRA